MALQDRRETQCHISIAELGSCKRYLRLASAAEIVFSASTLSGRLVYVHMFADSLPQMSVVDCCDVEDIYYLRSLFIKKSTGISSLRRCLAASIPGSSRRFPKPLLLSAWYLIP